MKINARVICLLLALPILVASALPTQAMTDKQEIELGTRVARDAEKQWGGALPSTNPMSQRVRRIGAKFARLSSRRSIRYSYKVLDNDRILNAFAAPGGPIYITRRLLSRMSNDAELAFVLGHETAHIDRRHMAQTFEKREHAQRAAAALGDKVLGKGKGQRIIALGTDVAFAVWSRGYSRDNESEADAWGARWMSRLGYDPRAAVSMLGKVSGGNREPSEIEKYLASHPAPEARRVALRRLIAKEKLLLVASEHGGPKLWSDDKVSSIKEEEPARHSNGEPSAMPQAATTPKSAAVPTLTPPITTPEPTPKAQPQREATPTLPPAKSVAKPTPRPGAAKVEPNNTSAPNAAPSNVVIIQEAKPNTSSQTFALLFASGAALLFAGALYKWFATKPRRDFGSDRGIISSKHAAAPTSIVLTTKQGARHQCAISPAVPVLIGRDVACDICLNDAQTSHRHAQITFDGQNYTLTDCGSTNGTWLNGRRVSSSPLREGDNVYVGQTILTIERLCCMNSV